MPPITRTQLTLYGGVSGNHNPIHIDIDFAKTTSFPDASPTRHAGHGARCSRGDRGHATLAPQIRWRFTATTQVHDRLTVEAIETGVTETGDRRLDVTVRDRTAR